MRLRAVLNEGRRLQEVRPSPECRAFSCLPLRHAWLEHSRAPDLQVLRSLDRVSKMVTVLLSPTEVAFVANPNSPDSLQVWAVLAAVSVGFCKFCLKFSLKLLSPLSFKVLCALCRQARMAMQSSRLSASKVGMGTKLVLKPISLNFNARSRCINLAREVPYSPSEQAVRPSQPVCGVCFDCWCRV